MCVFVSAPVRRACERLYSLDKSVVLMLNKSPLEWAPWEKWTQLSTSRRP